MLARADVAEKDPVTPEASILRLRTLTLVTLGGVLTTGVARFWAYVYGVAKVADLRFTHRPQSSSFLV